MSFPSTHPFLSSPCSAFEGVVCIASGALRDVALAVKLHLDALPSDSMNPQILVLEESTSEVVELDMRGTSDAVLARLVARFAAAPEPTETLPVASSEAQNPMAMPSSPKSPGRPKLGVVAREVTLLPRHWDWLGQQTGGASVALRKLVDAARKQSAVRDQLRHGQAVVYKAMVTLASNMPGFEEASRALFADDRARFSALLADWPMDVRDYVLRIAAQQLPAPESLSALQAA